MAKKNRTTNPTKIPVPPATGGPEMSEVTVMDLGLAESPRAKTGNCRRCSSGAAVRSSALVDHEQVAPPQGQSADERAEDGERAPGHHRRGSAGAPGVARAQDAEDGEGEGRAH